MFCIGLTFMWYCIQWETRFFVSSPSTIRTLYYSAQVVMNTGTLIADLARHNANISSITVRITVWNSFWSKLLKLHACQKTQLGSFVFSPLSVDHHGTLNEPSWTLVLSSPYSHNNFRNFFSHCIHYRTKANEVKNLKCFATNSAGTIFLKKTSVW